MKLSAEEIKDTVRDLIDNYNRTGSTTESDSWKCDIFVLFSTGYDPERLKLTHRITKEKFPSDEKLDEIVKHVQKLDSLIKRDKAPTQYEIRSRSQEAWFLDARYYRFEIYLEITSGGEKWDDFEKRKYSNLIDNRPSKCDLRQCASSFKRIYKDD